MNALPNVNPVTTGKTLTGTGKTGTGRCGTTFLVRLFTILGLDTGYSESTMEKFVYQNCNAGLEIQDTNHTIIKSPEFSNNIKELNKQFDIELVIVPIRNINEATNSRTKHKNQNGGFTTGIKNHSEMLTENYRRIATLIQDLVIEDINYVLINFHKMIKDSKYLFTILEPLINKYSINYTTFVKAYLKASNLSSK
jgi:hypothetical protein